MIERDYIDSYEENKNGIMALKKAMDLGGEFNVRLENGETITIAAPAAKVAHDYLIDVHPAARLHASERMMKSRAEFTEVVRTLVSCAQAK